jgi:hypothetical protein
MAGSSGFESLPAPLAAMRALMMRGRSARRLSLHACGITLVSGVDVHDM